MTDHTDADARAAEIVALINASPRTPRVEEIAAIIARPTAPAFSIDDPLAEKWEHALAKFDAACARYPDAEDAEADELLNRLDEATLAIWRRGARSIADLGLFARLARYWQWRADDPFADAEFKENLVPSSLGLDQQSLAQLVDATLKVTGTRA